MDRVWFIFIFGLCPCSAVIYHLNDTEYERMPPLTALDEYQTCLGDNGGIYCLLQLNLYAEPDNELMHLITEYSNHSVKHYNHSIIDRGVCVRKTCAKFISSLNTTADLTRSLEICLNDSLRREYGLNAKVTTVYYCDQHDEPMDIDVLDWIVLAVIMGLVIMNIVGSVYDYKVCMGSEECKEGNAYLLSFSVIRNWKWLLNVECNDPTTRDLQSLHGVRVISNICMMLAHVMLLISTGHTTNPHDFEKTYELPLYHLIYSGMSIVQIFFFISGFLTVYNLQVAEKTRTLTAWDIPKIILLRFSRLTPMLAINLAISVTWVRHVGSGPLWNLFVTGALVGDCRKYWWHTLLFINNYMPDNKYCLIPTWHLAADMQVFLICVTAYILTSRRQRYRVLCGLLLLGMAGPAIQTVLQDLDAIVILTPEFYRTLVDSTFRFQHILGHSNLPCFIIGMITAIALDEWQKKGYNSVNKLYSYMLYMTVVGLPFVFYTGRMFYRDGERPSLLFRAVYSSAIRPVLGVMSALAVPGLITKTPSIMKSVFEWRFWMVPSRLTYCVFLLHMILVHIMMGARSQLSNVSFFNVAVSYLAIVLLSYLMAIPVYLMVEAPFTRTFKNMVREHPDPSSSLSRTKKEKTL